MKWFGWVGKLKPGCVDRYIALHADTWPAVLARISDCQLQNYSIYHKQLPHDEHLLFSYFEYMGEDFQADMQRMASDPQVQRWWDECKPCFEHIEGLSPGEVWLSMDQVFFHEGRLRVQPNLPSA